MKRKDFIFPDDKNIADEHKVTNELEIENVSFEFILDNNI